MKPVSSNCARSDRDCRDCTFRDCNCDCHKGRDWKSLLKMHAQKRYFMKYGKSGVWYVMDRGTLKQPTMKVKGTYTNRLDAHRALMKLNKEG